VAFEITFVDPPVIQGKPVLPFLHNLSGLVDNLVGQFAGFLK